MEGAAGADEIYTWEVTLQMLGENCQLMIKRKSLKDMKNLHNSSHSKAVHTVTGVAVVEEASETYRLPIQSLKMNHQLLLDQLWHKTWTNLYYKAHFEEVLLWEKNDQWPTLQGHRCHEDTK